MTTKAKAQDKHKMSEIDENISKLFDIKKRLGKGAYGIVWKALDKRTNETLAVKKIFDAFRDETDAQRTFREIIFLKAFRSHPNVIKLQNVYRASNNLDIYLIFEYMESDLHNIIKKGTILKDIHKRYVMYQLINAIKYIHSGNVIHRDLKPSNVLIDSKCRCKLADFGLARSVSNRPARGEDDHEKSNEYQTEPLLTDYVATRWYRAPEILVASKRYTKGIDMWSLGCILAEMIRGKPLFQGSSTVNQIEKIVSALPDITDHDINAVGAGFGSVLLSKQISKECITTLDELLADAPHDAVNMVKSLLVLDPLGRLTAKEALGHHYVEKFRNSIPEIELNMDILPPFRDDVRLTVPEYRSKLYEIVQMSIDKSNGLRKSIGGNERNSLGITKSRENKYQSITQEKIEVNNNKKISRIKQNNVMDSKYLGKEKYFTTHEKHESETYQTPSNSTVASKPSKKMVLASPEHKRRSKKPTSSKRMTNDTKYVQQIDERAQFIVVKNKTNQSSKQVIESTEFLYEKRHSIDCGGVAKHTVSPKADANDLERCRKIHRSSSSLHRNERAAPNEHAHAHAPGAVVDIEKEPMAMAAYEQLKRNTTAALNNITSDKLTHVRNIKSDVVSSGATLAPTAKAEDRICYEKRLKKLEEEIEKYKKEVKSFCKETYRYTQQPKISDVSTSTVMHQDLGPTYSNNSVNIMPTMPNKKSAALPAMAANGGTPKKNPYFQLLTRGNRDFIKPDMDYTYTGTGGSGDHIGHTYHANHNHNNNNNNSKGNSYDIHNEHVVNGTTKSHHDYIPNHHHHQNRLRPTSKFILRP